jgi:protocatechuate 3,4-dioxygenase beta subunit
LLLSPKLVRNAWLNRVLVAIGLLAAVGAIWLSRWAREQPAPTPSVPGDSTSADPRTRHVPGLPSLTGDGPETLAGTVIDYAGAPLTNVTVSAFPEVPATPAKVPATPAKVPATPQLVAVAATDGDGRFALRGLEAGVYRLRVDGDGVFAGAIRFADVPGAPVQLVVSRRVWIAGRVADGTTPAPGVTVAVSGGGVTGVQTTTADAQGAFRFDDLVEWSYQVWAYAGARASRATFVERFGGGPYADVSLVMGPAAVLHGRVLDDETGRGLVADVMLTYDGDDEPPRYATSDEQGAFSIEGVPFGSWFPEARADGYVATEVLGIETERIDRVDIRLARGGIVQGEVVDAAGAPIRGASVSLRGTDLAGNPIVASAASRRGRALRFRGASALDADNPVLIPRGELGVMPGPIPFPPPPGARAPAPLVSVPVDVPAGFSTDADGRFRIDGLPPGRYTAHATHAEYAPGESAPVTVVLSRDAPERRIVLSPGVVIYGEVRTSGGAPVVGATITAEVDDDVPLAVSVTGPEGTYRLRPLARNVRLRASASGYGATMRPVDIGKPAREVREKREDFELVSADAAISGRVLDPLDRALAGAVIVAGNRNVVSDAEGRFTIAGVAPGEYPVLVSHRDYPPARVTLLTDRAEDISVPQGGGITLDVRDAHTTDAIAIARIVATGPGGAEHRANLEAGTATLAPLAVGAWQVRVIAPGYVPRSATVRVPAARGPREISVRDVRVDLERGATVGGVVRDRHGERVARATVTAGEVSVESDADGNFRMVDVPTGNVTISARKGADRGATTVALRPGDEVVTLEVTLD